MCVKVDWSEKDRADYCKRPLGVTASIRRPLIVTVSPQLHRRGLCQYLTRTNIWLLAAASLWLYPGNHGLNCDIGIDQSLDFREGLAQQYGDYVCPQRYPQWPSQPAYVLRTVIRGRVFLCLETTELINYSNIHSTRRNETYILFCRGVTSPDHQFLTFKAQLVSKWFLIPDQLFWSVFAFPDE